MKLRKEEKDFIYFNAPLVKLSLVFYEIYFKFYFKC